MYLKLRGQCFLLNLLGVYGGHCTLGGAFWGLPVGFVIGYVAIWCIGLYPMHMLDLGMCVL